LVNLSLKKHTGSGKQSVGKSKLRDVILDELFKAIPDFSHNLERDNFFKILAKLSIVIPESRQLPDQVSAINLIPPVAGESFETQQEPSRAPNLDSSSGAIDSQQELSNATNSTKEKDSASSAPSIRDSPYPLRNRTTKENRSILRNSSKGGGWQNCDSK
jgi:hypothetical protein